MFAHLCTTHNYDSTAGWRPLVLTYSNPCFVFSFIPLHCYTNEFTSVLEQKSQWKQFLPGRNKQGCLLNSREKTICSWAQKYLQFHFPGISYLIPFQWAVSRRWDMLVNNPIPGVNTGCVCAGCGFWPVLCPPYSCGMLSCIVFPPRGWYSSAITIQDYSNLLSFTTILE